MTMDILAKARKLESHLARTVDRAAQQWSKSGPRGPLEVLHGVLEAVEERIEPVGRGMHVFPFNTITATIVAVSPTTRARFSGVLDGAPSLQERSSRKLREVDRAAQQWSKSGPRGPLEVLHGVLEAVEERIEPVGRGMHVFPFNTITATIVAVSPDTRARFSGVLDGAPSLQERISRKLR